MRFGVSVLALVACLSGCAGPEDGGLAGSSGGGWAKGPEHTSDVTIEFTHVDGWAPQGGGLRLECPETRSSDNADMTNACHLLESLPAKAFGNVDGQLGCSMRIDGPQTAHIAGMIDGREVDAYFDRRNGCNNQRWRQIEPLVRAVTSPPAEQN